MQILFLLLLIVFNTTTLAENVTSLQITCNVEEINELHVSNNTYAITTNVKHRTKKISAYLDVVIPDVNIYVNVTAPSTGISTGMQLLGTSPVVVVTDITSVSESNLAIEYIIDNPNEKFVQNSIVFTLN